MDVALSINGSNISLFHSAPALTIPYISVLSLASVFGTLGNLLVISTLNVPARSQGSGGVVGSVFIVNLACSDLIVTAIINPVAIAGTIIGPSLYDSGGRRWMCTFLASLCITSCVVSLLSVGCISVNRYVYICRNNAYNRLFSKRTSYVIIAATWIVGVALDLPNHTGWSAHAFDRKTQKCLWDRTSHHQYTIFFISIGMLLPLAIILLCYWRIFAHIRKAKMSILQFQSGDAGSAGTTQIAFVKTLRQIKVVFLIFIAFSVCWAPYIVVLLSDEHDRYPLPVHLYASMIAHLHASVNFIIYGLTTNGLRAEYRNFIVRRLCTCCTHGVVHTGDNAANLSRGNDDFNEQTASRAYDRHLYTSEASRPVNDKNNVLAMNEIVHQRHV